MTSPADGPHPLAPYGWDGRRQALWSAAPPGAVLGRVVRTDRGRVTAQTAAGPVPAAAGPTRWPPPGWPTARPPDGGERAAPGRGRRDARAEGDDEVVPTTGDWVALEPSGEHGGGGQISAGIDAPWVVVGVLPRASRITRVDALGRDEQVLAANVDAVLVVHGLDRPLKLGRIERTLVLAWDSGAEPAVVLTKADLVDEGAREAAVAEVAASAGRAPVHVVSGTTGEGLGEVRAHLLGDRTAVVLGESGSGKSTLVNSLVGAEVLATGRVRTGDAKGRHTTVSRDLVLVPTGGVLVDTPGLRSLGLWDAAEGVALAYPDIDALAEGCRFRDCSHGAEPGCAVRAAEARGELSGARIDRYLELGAEVAEAEARRDALTQQDRRRRRRPPPRSRRDRTEPDGSAP